MAKKVSFLKFEKLKDEKKDYLIKFLKESYDFDTKFLKEYSFYYNTSSSKVYISSASLDKLDIKRVNMIGLYFGTFHDEKKFRLSIEGSKFIKANKNYVIIEKNVLSSYLSAENLFTDEVKEINSDDSSPFLIVKYEDENIGCVSLKDKFLLNYVPKARKLDYNKVF